MLWVARQPDTQMWPTRNPYECPVAAYLTAIGHRVVVVLTIGIQLDHRYIILEPQNKVRQLIARIDRVDKIIHRDHVLEIGKRL